MAQSGQRKCLCCKLFFDPDHRNRERQRYCPLPDCRLASKSASQAAWLAKPQNQDYFQGAVHVVRVHVGRSSSLGWPACGYCAVSACRRTATLWRARR